MVKISGKSKLLVVTPRLPEPWGGAADRELAETILEALQTGTVNIFVTQTMFLNKKAVDHFGSHGAGVILLREGVKSVSFEKYAREYAPEAIYFSTYLTAKYYLPRLAGTAGKAAVIIDARKSQYLMKMAMAAKCADEYERINTVKDAEIDMTRELPVLAAADAVLVNSVGDKSILENEIPAVAVTYAQDAPGGLVKRALGLAARRHKAAAGARGRNDCEVAVIRGYLRKPSPKPDLVRAEIELHTEGSFAKDCNRAIRKGRKEYMLILTDDVIIYPESVEALLFCLRSSPVTGLAMPMTNCSGESLTTPEGMKDFLPKHYLNNYANWHTVKNPGQIHGSCLLVRRRIRETVGEFDGRFNSSRYAIYDMSLKLLQLGCRIIVNNEAFAYHREWKDCGIAGIRDDHRLLQEKWCDQGTEFLEGLYD